MTDSAVERNATDVDTPSTVPEREAEVLGRIMAAESAKMAAYYRSITSEDTDATADAVWAPADEERRTQVIASPPDQVDWWGLDQLAKSNPEAAAEVWKDIKRAARDELDSGHFAAAALDVVHSPLDRARFLAMREAFGEELRPRGAIEQALVDTLVHAYLEQQSWLRAYHVRTQLRAEEVETKAGVARHRRRLAAVARTAGR